MNNDINRILDGGKHLGGGSTVATIRDFENPKGEHCPLLSKENYAKYDKCLHASFNTTKKLEELRAKTSAAKEITAKASVDVAKLKLKEKRDR